MSNFQIFLHFYLFVAFLAYSRIFQWLESVCSLSPSLCHITFSSLLVPFLSSAISLSFLSFLTSPDIFEFPTLFPFSYRPSASLLPFFSPSLRFYHFIVSSYILSFYIHFTISQIFFPLFSWLPSISSVSLISISIVRVILLLPFLSSVSLTLYTSFPSQ